MLIFTSTLVPDRPSAGPPPFQTLSWLLSGIYQLLLPLRQVVLICIWIFNGKGVQYCSWKANVLQRLAPTCPNTPARKFLIMLNTSIRCLRSVLGFRIRRVSRIEVKLCKTVTLQKQDWTPSALWWQLLKSLTYSKSKISLNITESRI